MSHAYADYNQISVQQLQIEDEHGNTVEQEGFVIPVVIPLSEVGELLANYDPTSGTSPGVTYSRPLSRVLLDALRRKTEE